MTLMNSRKGKELWERFMALLKTGGHIYDGFPVKCDRHPNRHALLCRPEGFNEQCPDGGWRMFGTMVGVETWSITVC